MARQEGKPWHEVLSRAEKAWNDGYAPRFPGSKAPSYYSLENFDEILKMLYEHDPNEMHALYPVGSVLDEETAREIFKYRPGDRVLVSMRTVGKRVGGPVSALQHLPNTVTPLHCLCSSASTTPSLGGRVGCPAAS